MHTKGEAAKKLKNQLGLDTCIYLGNDLNDLSMFSNALEDNDFIVIANNEHQEITRTLVDYLEQECKLKGINWKDINLLVLAQQNVNRFLRTIRRVLGVINAKQRWKSNIGEYR